jgi:hypothetical protein
MNWGRQRATLCSLVALSCLVAQAGCAGRTPDAVAPAVAASTPAVEDTSAPTTKATAPPIRATSVAAYSLPATTLHSNLALFGRRFVVTLAGRGVRDAVTIGSIRIGNPRTVARSAWRHGLINSVAGSGHWVAWVDQSHIQGPPGGYEVLWRVWAKNLATGRTRLLDSNGDTPDFFVPSVYAVGGDFLWDRAIDGGQESNEEAWSAGAAAAPEVLVRLRGVETPTSRSGRLVFLSGAVHQPARGRARGGDCWTVPLTGGHPRPLTDNALAMQCGVSGGRLIWSERNNGRGREARLDADPHSYWSRRLGGGARLLLRQGGFVGGWAAIGAGFVAWQGGDTRYTIHATGSSAQRHIRPGGGSNADARFVAQGHLLIFTLLFDGGRQVGVHVFRVTP